MLYKIGHLVIYSDIIAYPSATSKQATPVFIPEDLRPALAINLSGQGHTGSAYTTLDMVSLRTKTMSNAGGIVIQGSESISQARISGVWVV